MRFEGKLSREGRFWMVEIPVLGVATQGRSRREALEMIADAIETLAWDLECEVTVHPGKGDRFELSANEPMALIALALSNRRAAGSLSLADMAARLRKASRNAFARYERGDTAPTISKLDELFRALDPDGEIVIGLSRC